MHDMFSPIEEIIADIRDGRMVIMVDDENRENEGDLLMAAAKVRPEDVNYMATHGRGLICLTLSRERCAQLRLPLMVSETDEHHATNFTISIEAAEGITTGISAHDRARTIQAAVAPDARPEDLRQPGHIFPVMAQPGGVLTRAGHTEAGCDLARLAGLEPAAAIVEILNDDGTMARRKDLERFARRHGIRMGTIADLIRYRLAKECNVERIADEDAGVIVILREQETSRDFVDAVEALGQVTHDLDEHRGGDAVLRTYGVGAQILRDLGLSKIRVLSAPKQMYAISGFDLEIAEYVES